MHCLHSPDQVHADIPADETLEADQAERVRNRQAAVAHLQAAAMTDDPRARNLLRWQGALLLLPHAKRSGGRPS